MWFSQEEHLGLQQLSISLSLSPCWFSQLDVMGTPLLITGAPHSSGENSMARISLLILNYLIVGIEPALQHVHPFYQSCYGFFISFMIELLFS